MAPTLQRKGSRSSDANAWRNWLARQSSRCVSVFCVPGLDACIRRGFHVDRDEIEIAGSPNEANVLLIAGPLGDPFDKAAAVAYAQIPRPRALVQLGNCKCETLPDPDFIIREGELGDLQRRIADILAQPYSPEAQPFAPDFIAKEFEDEDEKEEGGEEHGHHDHEHDEGDESHEEHDHGGDEDNFMSMVMMTKDMPRSEDGLAMSRSEAKWGPYFPGLPAGVIVQAELDGDSIASLKWAGPVPQDEVDLEVSGSLEDAASRIADLGTENRFAVRALAIAALAQAAGSAPTEAWWLDAIPLLETERIESHLAWLLVFSESVGLSQLRIEVARCLSRFRAGKLEQERLEAIWNALQRRAYLKRRLSSLGRLPTQLKARVVGPIARAANIAVDQRSELIAYQRVGFAPETCTGDSAWSRLETRLKETRQSLNLIELAKLAGSRSRISSDILAAAPNQTPRSGISIVETPQGAMRLELEFTNGSLQRARFIAPSSAPIEVVPKLADGLEISDALVAICSLDINVFAGPVRYEDPEDESESEHSDHCH